MQLLILSSTIRLQRVLLEDTESLEKLSERAANNVSKKTSLMKKYKTLSRCPNLSNKLKYNKKMPILESPATILSNIRDWRINLQWGDA